MKVCWCFLLLGLAAASALQFDSDLVFDENELSSHRELRAQHRRPNSSKWHRKSIYDHQMVSPVQSPLENLQRLEPEPPKESNLGIFERAKRFLGIWDDPPESDTTPDVTTESNEKTSSAIIDNYDLNEPDILPGSQNQEDDDEDTDLIHGQDQDQTNDLGDVAAAHRSNQDSRADTNDDEDLSNDPSGDGIEIGSGLPSTSRPDLQHQQTRFYRFTITINEPYHLSYEDRSSDSFRQIAQNLSNAVNILYEDLPGHQQATIIEIKRTDDVFLCKVTFDLGTVGFDDREVIRDRLYRHITNFRKLGSLSVTEEGFTMREFGGRGNGAAPTPQCAAGELTCRSGECLLPNTRCDGRKDCRDGSDELGCPSSSIITDTSATTPPPVSVVTLAPGGVPVPVPAPIDRCRADDKVQCADGSVFICTVQRCDGHPDCPGGDDEDDCPLDNECPEGEFMCDVTRCILISQRCDRRDDCTDGTDEQDCPPGGEEGTLFRHWSSSFLFVCILTFAANIIVEGMFFIN